MGMVWIKETKAGNVVHSEMGRMGGGKCLVRASTRRCEGSEGQAIWYMGNLGKLGVPGGRAKAAEVERDWLPVRSSVRLVRESQVRVGRKQLHQVTP